MGIRDFVDTFYESDHTKFMREQIALHPEWAEDKKIGRAIWWDKPVDLDEQSRYAEARESHKGYPYNINPKASTL